jgi:hypothetical protein
MTHNPADVHNRMMETIRMLLDHLENFPSMVTAEGVMTAKEWLKQRGVDFERVGNARAV